MTRIERQKNLIRQLKSLFLTCDPQKRPTIGAICRRQSIRLALMLLQGDLEASTVGEFDPVVSRKLDAIELLLTE